MPRSKTRHIHVRTDDEAEKAVSILQSVYRRRGLVHSKSDITRYALIEVAKARSSKLTGILAEFARTGRVNGRTLRMQREKTRKIALEFSEAEIELIDRQIEKWQKAPGLVPSTVDRRGSSA